MKKLTKEQSSEIFTMSKAKFRKLWAEKEEERLSKLSKLQRDDIRFCLRQLPPTNWQRKAWIKILDKLDAK